MPTVSRLHARATCMASHEGTLIPCRSGAGWEAEEWPTSCESCPSHLESMRIILTSCGSCAGCGGFIMYTGSTAGRLGLGLGLAPGAGSALAMAAAAARCRMYSEVSTTCSAMHRVPDHHRTHGIGVGAEATLESVSVWQRRDTVDIGRSVDKPTEGEGRKNSRLYASALHTKLGVGPQLCVLLKTPEHEGAL